MRQRPFHRSILTSFACAAALVAAAPPASAAVTELFFSEYIEGSSNNKALEIYNGTSGAIDLALGSYVVQMYFNGSASAGTTVTLSGTVAAGDVFVLAQASANATILGQADQTSASSFYNGDDAIVLRKGGVAGTIVDVIGDVGFDPGSEWGSLLQSTADNTLRRMASVCAGDTNSTDDFVPSVEWDGFATDTFGGLGSHTANCGDLSGVGAANPVSGESGATTTLTVTVTPGQSPASTGITVTVDLTSVGGGASVALLDDGFAPDVTAGDNIFTVDAAPTGTAGSKSLPFSVADAQARSANGNIAYTIDPSDTPIHTIQGSGIESPFDGTLVKVTGIVTALRFNNGFFLQEPDADIDADPATSEGIFVFTSSPPTVDVGDEVEVVGTVLEFVPSQDLYQRPVTEITSPGLAISAPLSTGNTLPAAITITTADTDPAGGIDQLEKYEGMRVHVDSLIVVAPTQGSISESAATVSPNGVFYGVLPSIDRPFREAGIDVHEPVPAPNPPAVPIFDANPERIRVDSDGQVGIFPGVNVSTGAVIDDITGVLDHAFRTYTILPDDFLTPVGGAAIEAVGDRSEHEFTVGGFNAQRFFDDLNDPSIGEPVLTGAAYDKRLDKASRLIREIMKSPDVIGMVEVENVDVLQDLADRVNADAILASEPDPGYVAYLLEGNDVGGIDVGFLVGSRVTVDNLEQIDPTATYIDPSDLSVDILNDRPSLVMDGTFTNDDGFATEITVIVNHLRSLGSINSPTDGERVRLKRRLQAEGVANYVQGRQVGDPDRRIVLVGDFNAFEVNDGYVDSMGTILGDPTPADEVVAPSDDLVDPDLLFLTESEESQRYSYTFDGNAQTLDHALINEVTACITTGIDHGRVNADFPQESYETAGTPERVSDHDPLVAYFRFPIATVELDENNPMAVIVTAPGSNSSEEFTLTATLTDPSGLGDICDAVPVTFTLNPVAPGTQYSETADVVSCAGGELVVEATFSGVAVNVYEVDVTVDNVCYEGTGVSVIAIYDPSLGFVSGGGRVINPNTGNPANFGVNVKYNRKGATQGSILYVEHFPDGTVMRAKSHSMRSLSIVGTEAVILTKNATFTPTPGAEPVGNYALRVRLKDLGEPGTSDTFGIQVTDPTKAIVVDQTFLPQTLEGGNVQVPHLKNN